MPSRIRETLALAVLGCALAAPGEPAFADPGVDPECGVATTAADRIEELLGQVHPYAYTGPGVDGQIRLAAMPLLSVANPAGANLRNWAFKLADDVGKQNPYGPSASGVDLDADSAQVRLAIQQARDACAP